MAQTKEEYMSNFLTYHSNVTLSDVGDAYEEGQRNPSDEIIAKICRLHEDWTNINTSEMEYIRSHWDDDSNAKE